MIVQIYRGVDEYISKLVGKPVRTGWLEVNVEEMSEEFKSQLKIDLERQRRRFEAEDARKLESEKREGEGEDKGESKGEGGDKEGKDGNENFLKDLDPSQWKKHDMYAILGLEKTRLYSTPEQIKAAYRRQVLRYHPDKLKQQGKHGDNDDSDFKCIQKAWEVLNDPVKRMQFDSIDPSFDESIPKDEIPKSDGEFYETFDKVFERNARFSKKQPVPRIGDENTDREQVEKFYSFWINFESWRRFEWLDEEEQQGTENRADKRWTEKKNKAAREKRKREDNARLIKLTEIAMKRDPRMLRWKEADKAAKEAKKNLKGAKERERAGEEAKKKAEEMAKAAEAKEAAKKAKEAAAAVKNALKAARRNFRTAIGEVSEWVEDPKETVKLVLEINVLVETVIGKIGDDLERLEGLSKRIKELKEEVGESGRALKLANLLASAGIEEKARNVKEEDTKEDRLDDSKDACAQVATDFTRESNPQSSSTVRLKWTLQETDLLINAAKHFPGGTPRRWEQITQSINRQIINGTCPTNWSVEELEQGGWSVEEVIKRAEELKGGSGAEVESVGIVGKKRDPRVDLAEPTIATHYFGDDVDRAKVNSKAMTHGPTPRNVKVDDPVTNNSGVSWTDKDQMALERAMKTIPADDPLRWDKVAGLVPGKTKKECLIRVKEIASQLKAKK